MSSATNLSSSTTSGRATDDKQEDNKELPVVDGLHEPFETPHITTAADKGQAAIQRHAATIRKLKEQEREIAEQHDRLQFMIDSLESRRQEYMALEYSQPIGNTYLSLLSHPTFDAVHYDAITSMILNVTIQQRIA